MFTPSREFEAKALLLGDRLDLRAASLGEVVSPTPLTVAAGAGGLAVLFRYGAAVLFQLDDAEERAFLGRLAGCTEHAFAQPPSDDAEVRVAPEEAEGPDSAGVVVIHDASVERLQVVAHALARSALLAHYEAQLAQALQRFEPLAEAMRRHGRTAGSGRDLLRQLGEGLSTELRMLGRAEVSEKPEMVWERPDLDRLYVRLAEEFELAPRDRALTRKLELLSHTASTILEVLSSRRMLRVEWYIVALIAVEVAIVVWDLLFRSG